MYDKYSLLHQAREDRREHATKLAEPALFQWRRLAWESLLCRKEPLGLCRLGLGRCRLGPLQPRRLGCLSCPRLRIIRMSHPTLSRLSSLGLSRHSLRMCRLSLSCCCLSRLVLGRVSLGRLGLSCLRRLRLRLHCLCLSRLSGLAGVRLGIRLGIRLALGWRIDWLLTLLQQLCILGLFELRLHEKKNIRHNSADHRRLLIRRLHVVQVDVVRKAGSHKVHDGACCPD